MPRLHSVTRAINPVFWSALLVLFVSRNIPVIWRELYCDSIALAGPNHSTNTYLKKLVGVNDATERLQTIYSCLPKDRAILVLHPEGDDECGMAAMLSAYLAWPRPVILETVARADQSKELGKSDRNSLGAIVLCGVGHLPGVELSYLPFGPHISILPMVPP